MASLDKESLHKKASRDASKNSAKDPTTGLAEVFCLDKASFLSKPALPPWQSAHGLCASRRVTGVPKRDDDSAPVAVLMYEGINKAAPGKVDNEYCHFGDKRSVCRC